MRIFKHDFIIFGLAYTSQIMSCRSKNQPDFFSYICGKHTLKVQQHNIVYSLVRKVYACNFECKVSNQDKAGAPHVSCTCCASNLRGWLNGSRKSMPFAVPMSEENPETTSVIVTYE